jgi:hypothetical protein
MPLLRSLPIECDALLRHESRIILHYRARCPATYNPRMSDEPKKSVGPWVTVVLVGLPLLYVLSFGPACWIDERLDTRTSWVSVIYRPIIGLANRSSFTADMMARLATFGARPGSTADFTNDELSWWIPVSGPGSVMSYRTVIECSFDVDESSDDEPDVQAPP